jgi:hypothetical protein
MRRILTAGLTTIVFGAVTLFGDGLALAQEAEAPSPQEIEQKVREIELLMKKAERTLARSTGARKSEQSSEDAAKRFEELLNEKAQKQIGKSAVELRKAAGKGSAEASRTLERLMQEARAETAKATSEMERVLRRAGESARETEAGVRTLLEATQRSGEQARAGIQWLLEIATITQPSSGGT